MSRRLNVARLWLEPLPGEQDVLLQIIGQPYADHLRLRMRQHSL